jgi:exodeoxyribonuclease VII small subunit
MSESLFDEGADEATAKSGEASSAGKASFEVVLEELETIVQKLETEQPSLEESLSLFERGMSLAKQGSEVLESAQARVDKIVAVAEDGSVETEPLPPMD